MKFYTLLASVLLLGCAHPFSAERSPSHTAEDIDKTILALSPFSLSNTEKRGAEKPWEFVQGHNACEHSVPAVTVPNELELEDQTSAKVKNWIHSVNVRTYKVLSCDERYKGVINSIFHAVHRDNYQPLTRLDAAGAASTIGFKVQKFESMTFKERSVAIIKSLVERPKYQNKERPNTSPDQELFKNDQPAIRIGQFELSSFNTSDFFHCAVSVKNLSTGDKEDTFLTACTSAGKPSYAPIFWQNELYVIYSDLRFDPNDPAKLTNPHFVLKLHKVATVATGGAPTSFSAIQEAYRTKQRNEPVLLELTEDKRPAVAHSEVVVPNGFSAAVDTTNPSARKIRLALNALYQSTSRLLIYQFNDSDFKLEKTIVVAKDLNETTEITGFNAQTLLYTQYSKDKLYRNFSYDVEKQTTTLLARSYREQPDAFVTAVHFYTAKDGRKLPLWITHRKGFKRFDPANFGVAQVYGGFNTISATAEASGALVHEPILLKNGFIAHVSVRGGGELGPAEFLSASGLGKQKTYDDFISATEFLYKAGFAGPKRVVSEGWSNGGLVVLVTALQRPDLYGAVVAGSPVTDVLGIPRMDEDVGSNWLRYEYGRLNSPEILAYWKANSPMQQIRRAKSLPPILLRTAYGDPAVNPGHALKFYKALQERSDRQKFFLFVRPSGSGHGPATTKDNVEENSYIQSFIFRTLSVP